MNLFNQTVLVKALGWTLVHSLWQGALMAVLLGISLVFLQKRSAKLRYQMSITALGITALLFVVTFGCLLSQELVNSQQMAIEVADSQQVLMYFSTETSGFLAILKDYFNANLPLIVLLWMIGSLVMSLRFLGGLAYITKLKHTNQTPIKGHFKSYLEELKVRFNIKQNIKLVESTLVKVPMVIGYVKPMILLPVGIVNHLSIKEVEAVLAHEVGHILRRDYLINMIQSVIEVVLFYHPAIWWMSAQIRLERENCCDDIAIYATGSSIDLAKALANLEVINNQKYQLSMGFLGNKNLLFNRISRVLGQDVTKRHYGGSIVSLCLLLTFVIATNVNARDNSELMEEFTTPAAISITADTIEPKQKKEKIIIKEKVKEKDTKEAKKEELKEVIKEYKAVVKEMEKLEKEMIKIQLDEMNNMEIQSLEGTDMMKSLNIDIDSMDKEISLFFSSAAFEMPEMEEEVFLQMDSNIIDWKQKFGDSEYIIIDGNNLIFSKKDGAKNKSLILKNDLKNITKQLEIEEDIFEDIMEQLEGVEHKEEIQKLFKDLEGTYPNSFKIIDGDMKIISDGFEVFMPDFDMPEMPVMPDFPAKIVVPMPPDGPTLNLFEIDSVKEELIKDGLLKEGEKMKLTVKENNTIKVNGKKIPESLVKKYNLLMNVDENE